MITIMITKPMSTEPTAVSAIIQFVINIMISEPPSMVTAATSVVRLVLRFCPSVSTSFVMRERISPVVFLL